MSGYTLESRVQKVERSNRRLHRMNLLLIALLLLTTAVGAISGDGVIRGRAIDLTSPNGRYNIEIKADDSAAVMNLARLPTAGSKSVPVLTITVDNSASGIIVARGLGDDADRILITVGDTFGAGITSDYAGKHSTVSWERIGDADDLPKGK